MSEANEILIKIYIRIYNELITEIIDLLADGIPEDESDFILILSIIAKRKQKNILKALNKENTEE